MTAANRAGSGAYPATQRGRTSASEATLRAAAAVPLLVVQDDRVVFASEAALRALGVTDGESYAGTELAALVHPADRRAARLDLDLVLSTGRPLSGVTRRLVDAARRPLTAVQILTPLTWERRPAVGVSFVVEREPREREQLADAPGRCAALLELTERQREIALLVAQGYSPVNIAAQLGLTVATTRTHLKQIYRRLGVSSRTELVRLVFGARAPQGG